VADANNVTMYGKAEAKIILLFLDEGPSNQHEFMNVYL